MSRWALAGVVLLVALVYWALASSGERGPTRTAPQPDDYVELHAQLPETDEADAPQAAAPTAPSTPAGDEAQPPPEAAQPPELPPPVRGHGPSRVLYEAFVSEPRDAIWADAEEQTIRELFTHEDLPEDLVQSAACRQTVCRFEVRWPDSDSSGYRTFKDLITGRWGGTIGIDYPPNSRQTRSLIVYVPRQGYTLADVAAGQDPQ